MVRIFFTLLLITIAINSNAQPIEKRYSSYLSEQGTINFLRPKKLDNTANVDKFVFDMTYISRKDSVTINCSLTIKSGGIAKELSINSGDKIIPGNAIHTLFRDVVKRGYTIRVTSRFSKKEIEECFKNSAPMVFNVTLTDGVICKATYKPSQWKKESLQVTRILETTTY